MYLVTVVLISYMRILVQGYCFFHESGQLFYLVIFCLFKVATYIYKVAVHPTANPDGEGLFLRVGDAKRIPEDIRVETEGSLGMATGHYLLTGIWGCDLTQLIDSF